MSKTKKLFASTASVALVAAAIVPAASAAQLNDIESVPGWAKVAVQHLADNNILEGDQNGNFNPTQTVTRAVAAQVVYKALDLPVEGTEDFSDVNAADWFYKAVVATSPEIFEGDGTGKFNPKDVLTREQAAKVLVDAYGLTGSADLSSFPDASKVSKWATSYVAIAVENGIISGKGALLAPKDKITRAEYATMVKRAIDKVANPGQPVTPEATVETVTATNGVITVNFDNELTAADVADFKVTLNNGTVANEVTPTSVILSADKKSVILTVPAVEQTTVEQNVVASVSYKGAEAKAAQAFKVEAKPVAVESVTAVTPNEVTLTLGVAIESLTKEDVVVTNRAGEKQYVKSVEVVKPAVASNTPVAASQTSQVKVTFYDDLKSNDSYTFSVKVGAQTLTKTFDFAIGQPAAIVVADQVVPATETTNLKFKVLDNNGLDITKNTKVDFETNGTITNGKVTLSNDENIFVEVIATTQDGKQVKSNRFKVTGQARTAAEISNWSLNTADAFDADTYKQDTTIALNETGVALRLELKDQFGDVLSAGNVAAHSITFESLDPSIAIIDAATGAVTARKAGTAPVKVTVKKDSKTVITKTVQLNVVSKATPTTIVTEKDAVTLYSNVSSSRSVTMDVSVEDQYEGEVSGAVVAAEVKTGKDLVTASISQGKLTINTTEGKKGTATIVLTSGELTKTITVTVKESGEVANYKVEGAKKVLDKNTSADSTKDNYNADRMTVAVSPVDANGEVAGDNVSFTVKVTGKDFDKTYSGSSAAINITDTDSTDATPYKVGETYTAVVKVGSLTVDSFTFEVKDTRTAPTYSVVGNDLTISSAANFNTLFASEIIELEEGATITDIDFVSTKASVIADNDASEVGTVTIGSKIEETVSIYVDTVTVTKGGESYELDLKGEKVDVTVDTKAPTFNIVSNTDGTVSINVSEKLYYKNQSGKLVALESGEITDSNIINALYTATGVTITKIVVSDKGQTFTLSELQDGATIVYQDEVLYDEFGNKVVGDIADKTALKSTYNATTKTWAFELVAPSN